MKYLLLTSALILSSTTAYFSVFGITKLFSGEFIPIFIMASGLEFSKIVSISFLSRNWKNINKTIRIYMSITSVVLILLTSIGIYGFLLHSYQDSKNTLLSNNLEIQNTNNSIESLNYNIIMVDNNIDILTKKYNDIIKNREYQERRLDTLYNRGYYSNANVLQKTIDNYNTESINISNSIQKYQTDKFSINDSINKLKSIVTQIDINTTNSDIGPIKYIADIIGVDINIIINYFIFIIIFVFDPMAIIMFIAFNKYKVSGNTTTDITPVINDNGEFEISFTNESL